MIESIGNDQWWQFRDVSPPVPPRIGGEAGGRTGGRG